VRARRGSERLVASVRLGIFLVVAACTLAGGSRADLLPTLGIAGAAITYGVLLFILQHRVTSAWVPWVVSAIDVSLASSVLLVLVVLGYPLAAVNNRVMFDWYFVAVTLAALRFDWRLCAWTTSLAFAQYLGIFGYVAFHIDLATASSETHGSFVPAQFVGRLLMLGGHGAAVVALTQWARHLRLMVGTDQLTGLLQRRPFFERIEEELQRADMSRTQLSVAIFDVDQFKRFNDLFGHLAGDRALQRIGERLRNSVRTTDLVARYGGEEFVIAFPRMDVELAMRRAEALRSEIGTLQLGPNDAPLTISGGVASWPEDGESFEAVLQRADERLYNAKASGRNLIIGPRPVGLPSAG